MTKTDEERRKSAEVYEEWRKMLRKGKSEWKEVEMKLRLVGDDTLIDERQIDLGRHRCPRFTCAGGGVIYSDGGWNYIQCSLCGITSGSYSQAGDAWKAWDELCTDMYLDRNGEWNAEASIQGYYWVFMETELKRRLLAIRYWSPNDKAWLVGYKTEPWLVGYKTEPSKVLRCWGPIPEPMIGEV